MVTVFRRFAMPLKREWPQARLLILEHEGISNPFINVRITHLTHPPSILCDCSTQTYSLQTGSPQDSDKRLSAILERTDH
jgi:hypothetical protein